MVTVLIFVGLLAGLIVAAVLDNKRRRSVREATLRPGLSPAARREVLRDQRVQNRAAQAGHAAERPYFNNLWDSGAGGL